MPIRPIDNERKACDGVARMLELRLGGARINARCPEKSGVGAPVDYVFELAMQTYALEHTIIEAFERQIHMGVTFAELVESIERALDHHMPRPGLYRLVFPIDPCMGLKPKDIPKLQEAIIAWVTSTAAELHAEFPRKSTKLDRPNRHLSYRRDVPPGLTFELYLSRDTHWALPDRADGRFFVSRFAPSNYEEMRIARMASAFDRKLPKLADWKASGALAILVLENGDLALTNHVIVGEVAAKILAERRDRPDQVWLVDTAVQKEWTVLCLIRDDLLFPDEDDGRIRYQAFNPVDLDEV